MSVDRACAVCGGTEFRDQVVIWDELAEGWGLTPEERRLTDRQQGTICTGCGANLRSIALAEALLAAFGASGTLREFLAGDTARALRLLEINEAGTLSPELARLPGHVLARYPEVDMQALPYEAGRFDVVVHSDTLEHVPDPARALAECRRVLAPEGVLCFTVPVLPGRLTRPMPEGTRLFHGSMADQPEDYLVHTDFGADVWAMVLAAGFRAVGFTTFAEGLAITAVAERHPLAHLLQEAKASRAELRRLVDLTLSDDRARAELEAMRASTSWRVTAPLRRARELLARPSAPRPRSPLARGLQRRS